ncbi:DNA-J related domain-containing protein [Psychromonas sp. MME2]|uniref:DNA-J related domain-containing protein n=1 Tax=unclassified Psychromonas TaxID=2614957 RepID=UPI00339C2F62
MINYQNSILLKLVKSHPEGIKEYDLLKLLQEQQLQQQQHLPFDNLALFQQHFLLFHALYKLSDQLRSEQAGYIVIEALNIQWLPQSVIAQQPTSLVNRDPLRAYYLDINNLHNTSGEEVDNLLASFWLKMSDDSEKQSALALFELNEPCDLAMVKKRYRQLLARHHPDKGGAVATAQALNEAMAVLKRYYAEG